MGRQSSNAPKARAGGGNSNQTISNYWGSSISCLLTKGSVTDEVSGQFASIRYVSYFPFTGR
jgi:hypothetical protein